MYFIIHLVLICVLLGERNTPIYAQGLYTHRIADFQIVVPRRVTADGAFLSHRLTSHHPPATPSLPANHTRQRRSPPAHPHPPVLHYQLPIDDRNYYLQLWPNRRFMAPGLRVERWRRDANHTTTTPTSPHCHYHGVVRGVDGSQVALSACDGLAGLIRVGRHEYWLEPHKGWTPLGEEHPHVVFKRSAITAPAKKRKRKKKRKHEKNCGTREPRRLTESRLEWKHQTGMVKVQGRGKSRKTRWRRSVSRERHVEALLVADTSMMTFHRDGDVETYLLTIMNLVSSLYRDPSIGHPVNVVVVRIVLLEDSGAQKDLNITVNAGETLSSFCRWQTNLNPANDSDPIHHDVAILVTREDICARANVPCNTLGVAHVAGMCQPGKSCNVNEDNGITLAHTITHELGHNFGMYHDTEKIGCSQRKGATLHVMTPSFEADTIDIAWSECSRRDITNFLDRGLGSCLEDEPGPQDFSYPDLPPGAMYDAEHQCRLQFGDKQANVCTPLEEICSRLWCGINNTCITLLRPAAAGTHCGKHKWCVNQECVSVGERPDPIPGGWGSWGSWSECSRTCGAGVSIRQRHCDHPVPAFGGKFCIGEWRRYKVCNTQPCKEGQPSFRAVQCSGHNRTPYQGKNYTWLPYFDTYEPCELYCSNAEDTLIVPWGESALDGTPCSVGTKDMCIAGICKTVGCDWVVGSDATEDECGVCRGDGTQCETVKGLYSRKLGSGYREVVVIPRGSRNIKVEEVGNSRNYIGIGSASSRKFFLNGKRQITLAGEYQIAGTNGLYEREKDNEKVRIPGPIKEDIMIYLIYRGRYRNFGLRYEYTVLKKAVHQSPDYRWEFSDWSPCSATCGGGHQTSKPVCREKGAGLVNERKCEVIEERSDQKMRACNTHACPARWWIGPWQRCPSSCSSETASVSRRRTVICVGDNEMALSDTECDGDDRPSEQESCVNLPPCYTTAAPTSRPTQPHTTEDIPTASTGDDNRGRDRNTASDERQSSKANSIKREDEASVLLFEGNNGKGSGWTAGVWGPCSTTCGGGYRKRTVRCAHSPCADNARPSDLEYCRLHRHCRQPSWHGK